MGSHKNILLVHKKSQALRSDAKAEVYEVNPNHSLFSYNTATGEIRKVMKFRGAYLDWNKVYKEPNCIHLPALNRNEASQLFKKHLEKKKSVTETPSE